MAGSKNSTAKKGNARGRTAPKRKQKRNNKFIAALVVILIILLIAAIIFISVKGLWGGIIDYVKSLIGTEDERPSIPAGTAKLEGDVLEVRMLDIGQGDCILILFPDGKTMVMDIGSEFGTTSPWNVIDGDLKELDIETIDYLFLTHTDYDHIRDAKKLIDNYQIKKFYFPRADLDTTETWKKAYEAARAETYLENGEIKKSEYRENIGPYEIVGENWTMKCYSFDEKDYPDINKKSSAELKNAVSPTCLLEYAGRTVVLTGDSNEKSEEYLIGKGYFDGVDADVLKVGHHGSRSSTSNEFLNKIDCEYAIISCGADNDYGHPTPEVLERLEKYRDPVPDDDYNGYAQVYRTDKDGTVTVQVDERGVMNLISEDDATKNTTTGTPYEGDSSDISGAVETAAIFSKRQTYDCDSIAA